MKIDRKTFLLQPAAPDLHRRFDAFCELFYRQKRVRAAFESHVADDYIQHSAGMAQGREAAILALEPMFARANFTVTPVRTLWDGHLATVILDVRMGEVVRAIVVDIYRHDRERIVEHWDVKAEIDTARRDSYFDGLAAR
jgi:predicted SnoaL-like aldol condensation-catalyzing enzyme